MYKELRIGNFLKYKVPTTLSRHLIKFNGETVVVVNSIEKGKFSDSKQFFIEGEEEPIITDEKNYSYKINNEPQYFFEFVKLTEEILPNLGFNVQYGEIDHVQHGIKSYKFFVKENLIIHNNEVYFKPSPVRSGEWIKKIEYVHQLQNIYLDLTGEELEINFNYGWK